MSPAVVGRIAEGAGLRPILSDEVRSSLLDLEAGSLGVGAMRIGEGADSEPCATDADVALAGVTGAIVALLEDLDYFLNAVGLFHRHSATPR